MTFEPIQNVIISFIDSTFYVIIFKFQVHIRVASPPIKYPCYMGINIPTREELIANKLDAHQLADAVGKKNNKIKDMLYESSLKPEAVTN